MKKIISTIVLALFIVSGFNIGCSSPKEDKSIGDTVVNGKPVMDEAKCAAKSELKTAMRKLWEDHVIWTRNVILNIMDDLPGTDQAVKRLLKNQDDIGDAIKPYYGDDAGNKLAALLHTHITQAADLLKAAKKNDKDAFDKIDKEWHDNADQIADFLSSANQIGRAHV